MKVLALDMGTSSVRGMVLDADAVQLPGALARRKVRVSIDRTGAGTLDGAGYLACLVECLDELHAAGHLDGIELVATAAQWHSIVPLDAAGDPLGPVLTWLDTRATPPGSVTGPADEAAFHARTGAWWHRFYWTVRVPWLRRHTSAPPARFVGLVEYVFGVLLDGAPMSVSQASGTGLLDLRAMTWDFEACELAGVRPGELPDLAPTGWRGRLRPAYAARWPALAAARWKAPIGDGAASNIGSGCVDENRAAVTVGTSAAVRLMQPAPAGAELPPLPATLWRYRVDHERIITGTAYSSGGNLFDWAERELRLPAGPALDEALERVTPGRSIPADMRFGGDRPPGMAGAGSGALGGLGFGSTAVDILAGLMDALCRQVADDLVDLESTVDRRVEVVLGGGAVAASAWWRRAFAAALAPRPVRHVTNPEVGGTGAGILALGRFGDIDAHSGIGRTDEGGSAVSAGRDRPHYPS
ncbi:FGGY family carbohydrate kinase [Polymorphospora sp. NPDC050346]|uniref:FGGY family carbohydrate kinase n=1 Tax=Polymorphospora sp. NPDC050346 TaxID=3155780 RepID=UPI0033CA98EA